MGLLTEKNHEWICMDKGSKHVKLVEDVTFLGFGKKNTDPLLPS